MNVRVSLGGDTVRCACPTLYGSRPLAVGGSDCATPAARSSRAPTAQLTFGGAGTATIAAGALLVSDPVALPLSPLGDLAISIHLPGDLPTSFGIIGR